MQDCIFCKIAQHEIPVQAIYETESLIAFDDAYPQAPVHCLIIPKRHYKDIADGVPASLMAELFSAANKLAEIKGVDKTGYRLVVNKGKDAGQTVFHLHIHLLGGTSMQEGSL